MSLFSWKLFTLLGVSVIGLTLFSFTFVSSPPQEEFYPVYEIGDGDKDTYPDDVDFYLNGDGGVRITVTSFEGRDSCKNILPLLNPRCQPKFWIAIDTDGDGKFDDVEGNDERSFKDRNAVEDALSVKANIPDDFTRVVFLIRVKDTDGDNWIDYWPGDKRSHGYFEFNLREGSRTWTYEGDGEVRCRIVVKAEIIGWTP